MTWRISTALILAALLPAASGAWADLTIQIRAAGDLEGAVLVARSRNPEQHSAPAVKEAVMLQANRQFEPYILPVPANVPVQFPNEDDTAHHVYSFSPVGAFELPLYKGDAPQPVSFSRPGVIPLGCNIHDWMIGYIYVVDSPWYTQIENGAGRFADLPDGEYELSLWHPALEDQPTPVWQVVVGPGSQTRTLEVNLALADASQPPAPASRFDEQWDY